MDSKKDVGRGTVLIVDDENDLLEICEYFFTKQFGYRVLTSNSSHDVIDLLQNNSVETLVLDLHLPQMNGLELFEDIRKIDSNLPIIIISAYYSLESAIEAFRNGAYDYVKKPFDFEALGKQVERAIEKYRLATQNQILMEKLERELERASSLQNFYQSVISSMSSGIITVDMKKNITILNQAAAEIIKSDMEKALGKPLTTVWNIHDIDTLLDKALQGEVYYNREVKISDDEIIGYTCSPLKGPEGEITGAIIIFKNITQLKKMQERMRQMDRLASLGQFTASLAHEIKNPIAGIYTITDFLCLKISEDTKEGRYIRLIKEELDRVNKLIAQMLNYSNPKPMQFTEIKLHKIVDDVLDLNNEKIKAKNIRMHKSVKFGGIISADEDQIKQVVLNLIMNAIDAVSEQGNITIEIEESENNENVILTIADDGVGIAEKDRKHIFEPFFSRKVGGFGLGLPTVARIIDAHNGKIELQDQSTQGTAFKVFLPIVIRNF